MRHVVLEEDSREYGSIGGDGRRVAVAESTHCTAQPSHRIGPSRANTFLIGDTNMDFDQSPLLVISGSDAIL